MTQHECRVYEPSCYRCDLSHDELSDLPSIDDALYRLAELGVPESALARVRAWLATSS